MRRVTAAVVIGVITALAAAACDHFERTVPCALSLQHLKHVFTPVMPPDAVHAIFLPTPPKIINLHDLRAHGYLVVPVAHKNKSTLFAQMAERYLVNIGVLEMRIGFDSCVISLDQSGVKVHFGMRDPIHKGCC